MGELFEDHTTMGRVVIIWAMIIISVITGVWALNIDTMTGPAAGLGGTICGIFAIAALTWRKSRGIE